MNKTLYEELIDTDSLDHAAARELDKIVELRATGKELTARDRLQIPVQAMPCQKPEERVRNMLEVATGYSETQAVLESERCLDCRNAPCVAGCPVGINIPGFIKSIRGRDFAGAVQQIKRSNLLPSICGRVCPQESQCQAHCTVGKSLKSVESAVQIGRLERFVADHEIYCGACELPDISESTGRKVAIVGSGPAGLTCAIDVRRNGHDVTIFEAFHKAGGVMVYGIPEFRLPKALVKSEAERLAEVGVQYKFNYLIGRTRSVHSLLTEDGFDAVFIGAGAGLPKFMNIPGENLVGVFSANEYLTRANLMRAYDREKAATPLYPSRRVAVLGGGNVAMDSARMALRLGAEEVHVIYRRTRNEMPARDEEIGHAMEEGVKFSFLCNPVAVFPDSEGTCGGIEIQRYELGEPDASGRCAPKPIAGSEYKVAFDTVIVAIGNESNPLLAKTTPQLLVNAQGRIIVDGMQKTSIDRVYAGGDIVLGAATVILAMGEGRKAAAAINAFLG